MNNEHRGPTLVERFIEFRQWPTSRKTALLTGISLPGLLLVGVIGRITYGDSTLGAIGDRVWSQLVFLAIAFAYLLSLAVSLVAARLGQEARWTAYLSVILIGGSLVLLIYGFGSFSTPYVACFPISVMVLTLWFDEKIGWFTFIAGGLAIAVVDAAQLMGLLPYAPGLLDRSVDAHQAASWVVGGRLILLIYFLVAFVLCILLLAARRIQDARLQEAQALIRRYVPAQVADAIISGSADTTGKHERRKLTILFSDLVGFTDISEELEPEDLSRVLNEYFSEMTAIAQKYGGTVDELSGDAILILFGAPHATDDKDHALRAVRMATEMQQAMGALNDKWTRAGITETLKVRMGINTGVVTIGDFGSKERMKYAALGKHVNLAARIQSHCEPGKVLVSHATWLLISPQIQCTPRGRKEFKGINKPVSIYELA